MILDSSLSYKFTVGYRVMPIDIETQRHLDERPASDLYGCDPEQSTRKLSLAILILEAVETNVSVL